MSYQKTDWENLPSTNTPLIASNLNNIESGIENLDSLVGSETYSSSSTYAVGDVCIYNNTLYVCKTKISTAEAWNSSHWTATTIQNEIEKNEKTLTESYISNKVKIYKCGKIVTISCIQVPVADLLEVTIPSAYRPTSGVHNLIIYQNTNWQTLLGRVKIENNGTITVSKASSIPATFVDATDGYASFCLTYVQ